MPRGKKDLSRIRSEAGKRAAARRARRERIAPRHIRMLARGEPPAQEWTKQLLLVAKDENRDFIEALGGLDHISPQRRALIEDAVTLGLIARALTLRFAQRAAPDSQLATRIASTFSARRAALVAIGLDRVRREMDLEEYLETKARGVAEQEPEPVVDLETSQTKGPKRHGKA